MLVKFVKCPCHFFKIVSSCPPSYLFLLSVYVVISFLAFGISSPSSFFFMLYFYSSSFCFIPFLFFFSFFFSFLLFCFFSVFFLSLTLVILLKPWENSLLYFGLSWSFLLCDRQPLLSDRLFDHLGGVWPPLGLYTVVVQPPLGRCWPLSSQPPSRL